MGKLVFAINMTVDGYFDHTAIIADDELHEKATELYRSVNILIFGRVMYQLMEAYWPKAVSDASLPPSVMGFANAINAAPKIVYTTTLTAASWNTTIKRQVDADEIRSMKKIYARGILLCGGAKLAHAFMDLDLIDEYRLIIHPVILGTGKPLFGSRWVRKEFRLVGRDIRKSGAVELIYEPLRDG
jgi:dihydrofolate reductase